METAPHLAHSVACDEEINLSPNKLTSNDLFSREEYRKKWRGGGYYKGTKEIKNYNGDESRRGSRDVTNRGGYKRGVERGIDGYNGSGGRGHNSGEWRKRGGCDGAGRGRAGCDGEGRGRGGCDGEGRGRGGCDGAGRARSGCDGAGRSRSGCEGAGRARDSGDGARDSGDGALRSIISRENINEGRRGLGDTDNIVGLNQCEERPIDNGSNRTSGDDININLSTNKCLTRCSNNDHHTGAISKLQRSGEKCVASSNSSKLEYKKQITVENRKNHNSNDSSRIDSDARLSKKNLQVDEPSEINYNEIGQYLEKIKLDNNDSCTHGFNNPKATANNVNASNTVHA